MKISVAKIWKDRGTSVSIETDDDDVESVVILEESLPPRTACLKAAKILQNLARKLSKLAESPQPYNADVQEEINKLGS